ncbi:MAG: hypothetical protein MUE30_05820 [Spirosomaceae bacterium]|jgi:hypothetical protein|nr:hypothetical protein [Spirosomataceae bacterium]
MNTNINHINQQMAYLNARHLEELALFVEFLLLKQEQTQIQELKPQENVLSDIQRIDIPVSHHIINRADLYDNRI